MKEYRLTGRKAFLLKIIVIIFMTAFAIIAHAILPAPVDDLNFDSVLVQIFGFPFVAVSYFMLLFTHCAFVLHIYGRYANYSPLEVGFRFGAAFALLYLIGMQEVVVEATPFGTWGYEYVRYQFFMGLGDALPVLLLCLIIAYFSLNQERNTTPRLSLGRADKILIITSVAVTFLGQRAIGYQTGLVESNVAVFPLPTYLWTLLFGLTLGFICCLIYPIFAVTTNTRLLSLRLAVVTIGMNWIIFNSFIGLIFSGAMPQMLIRSGIDTAVLFLTFLAVCPRPHRRPRF